MGRRLGQCLERIRDSGNVCTCCVGSCRVEGGLLDQPSLLVLVSPHALGHLWDTKELFCAQPHPGQTLSLSSIIPFCRPFPWRAALS